MPSSLLKPFGKPCSSPNVPFLKKSQKTLPQREKVYVTIIKNTSHDWDQLLFHLWQLASSGGDGIFDGGRVIGKEHLDENSAENCHSGSFLACTLRTCNLLTFWTLGRKVIQKCTHPNIMAKKTSTLFFLFLSVLGLFWAVSESCRNPESRKLSPDTPSNHYRKSLSWPEALLRTTVPQFRLSDLH